MLLEGKLHRNCGIVLPAEDYARMWRAVKNKRIKSACKLLNHFMRVRTGRNCNVDYLETCEYVIAFIAQDDTFHHFHKTELIQAWNGLYMDALYE